MEESSSVVMKNEEKNNVLEMKTYQCSVCSEYFAEKDFLNRHLRSHEEFLLVNDDEKKKPQVCDICKEIFTEESDYTIHLCSHLR